MSLIKSLFDKLSLVLFVVAFFTSLSSYSGNVGLTVLKKYNWTYVSPIEPQVSFQLINNTAESVTAEANVTINTDKKEFFLSKQYSVNIEGNAKKTVTYKFDADPGYYNVNIQVGDTSASYNICVNPEQIAYPDYSPSDFKEFWDNAKAELAAVPMNAVVTKQDDMSNSVRNVYLVEMQSVADRTSDGNPVVLKCYYAEPVEKGVYPVLIRFLGYDNVRASMPTMKASSNPGFVEIAVCLRGQQLTRNALYTPTYLTFGIDDKEEYYYKKGYLDAVRILDFISTRRKADKSRIYAIGGSQGGAVVVAAAALGDNRIASFLTSNAITCTWPEGLYMGTWMSKAIKTEQEVFNLSDEKVLETLSYFDPINLAKWITCPLYLTTALQDNTARGRTVLPLYNNLVNSQHKEFTIFPNYDHHVPQTALANIYQSYFPNYTLERSEGNNSVVRNNVEYEVNEAEDAYCVKGFFGSQTASVSLESYIYGLPVTSIADSAFFNCDTLTHVDIPSTVNVLGKAAFCGCTSLQDISIPGSIESISNNLFRNCTGLKSVNIPSSVCYIGTYSFSGCRNADFQIEPAAELTYKSSSFPKTSKTLYLYENEVNVSKISSMVTELKESFGNIVVVKGVSQDGLIYDYDEESDSYYLSTYTQGVPSEITIPSSIYGKSVTSVAENALKGCTTITSLTIPNSVTSIGASAFENCISLESIVMPAKIYTARDDMFKGCTSLKDVTLPSKLKILGANMFNGCTSLESIVLPEGVTTIKYGAFRECSSLKNVNIPSGVTAIKNYVFNGCVSLKELKLPSGLTSIDQGSFSDCAIMEKIKIPETLTSVGSRAFNGCLNLTSVYLPKSVKSIGERAFAATTLLKDIYITPNAALSYNSLTFDNCKNKTLHLIRTNANSSKIDEIVNSCSSLFKSIVVENTLPYCLSIDNGLSTTLYLDHAVSIPSNVMLVFYCKALSENVVRMTKLTDVIPAYTAVVVVANSGDYYFPAAKTSKKVYSNLLKGVTEDTDISMLGNNVLTYSNSPSMGFYSGLTNVVKANTAYISTDDISVKELLVSFDYANSIDDVFEESDNDGYYTLQGIRVEEPRSGGIYIRNGKKVLVK